MHAADGVSTLIENYLCAHCYGTHRKWHNATEKPMLYTLHATPPRAIQCTMDLITAYLKPKLMQGLVIIRHFPSAAGVGHSHLHRCYMWMTLSIYAKCNVDEWRVCATNWLSLLHDVRVLTHLQA